MKSKFSSIFRLLNKLKDKYKNRLTPVGTFFIYIFFISTIFGMNPEKNMMYQIGIFSISLLFFGFLITIKFNTKIKIKRYLPDTCTINTETRYTLSIVNKNRRKISGLSFRDKADPIEMTSEIQYIPDINRGDHIETEALFIPKKRGYIYIEGIQVFREDPLGLTRKKMFIKNPANILVLPKMYEIPLLKFTGKRKYNQGGIPFAEKKGDSEEFISLKKYTPGDPIKKINWKSSAKVGETIVNEYQDEYFSRYGLVLDTFSKQTFSQVFEEAVSIAATILSSNNRGSSILDFMFLGIKPYTIPVGNGISSQKSALEILSSISTCTDRKFTELISLIKKNIPLLNSLILLLIDIDEERAELINFLHEYEIEFKVLIITDNIEKCRKKARSFSLKTPVKILKSGEIERSLNEVIL